MASAYDWSSTAASNATADSDITWAEGQNPNTVNDSARQMMKRVRDTLTDIAGATLVTGTANGLLLTAGNAFTTLATGRIVCFRAASSNTGAATLNVNGIGAKSIRYIGSDGDAEIPAGMVQSGGIYVAIYGAHLNSSAGGWMLLNPTNVSEVLTLPQINDTTGDHQYVFAVNELTADRTVTLPLLTGNDEFVFKDHTQTLTNKTLTSPVVTGLDASLTAKGIIEIATAAEYLTGTDDDRALTPGQVYDAAAEVTLTDAATIAVDMGTFINATVTLGGNRTLGNPTNAKAGQSGVIAIVQDGTGSRTLAYGSNWKFAGGSDPVLTTTATAIDLLFYHARTPTFIFANLVKLVF